MTTNGKIPPILWKTPADTRFAGVIFFFPCGKTCGKCGKLSLEATAKIAIFFRLCKPMFRRLFSHFYHAREYLT